MNTYEKLKMYGVGFINALWIIMIFDIISNDKSYPVEKLIFGISLNIFFFLYAWFTINKEK